MPDTSTTSNPTETTVVTETPETPSPSGFFGLSAFGAVTLVKRSAITIPDDVRAALAEVPGILATLPNTQKIHLDLRARNAASTEADAEQFRTYIREYAEQRGDLNAYLPVFVDGHWSRKDADAETGIYGPADAPQQAKWIEPNGAFSANGVWKGVDPTWNVGHDITFRLTVKKAGDDDESTVDTATVTVTQGTPQPARKRSRGNVILGK